VNETTLALLPVVSTGIDDGNTTVFSMPSSNVGDILAVSLDVQTHFLLIFLRPSFHLLTNFV
jgi:hypothetical protein